MLPNYDFFNNIKFDQPQESYVVSGSVIGEIAAVTGRRFDMTIDCETAVQVSRGQFLPFILQNFLGYFSVEDKIFLQLECLDFVKGLFHTVGCNQNNYSRKLEFSPNDLEDMEVNFDQNCSQHPSVLRSQFSRMVN